jgi:hypothetical protein
MTSLSHLNKYILSVVFFILLIFSYALAEDEPADIWQTNENKNVTNNGISIENETEIKNINLSENKITQQIDEDLIDDEDRSVIGILDPEKNNFNLNMWSNTDGEEIKKVLSRINKLKLAPLSENLLYQILFTNAYAPQKNLSSKEFLEIKVNWLIKNKKINNLENFVKSNPEVGQSEKVAKFLINEYLSNADIKSACDKMNLMNTRVQNNYLEKFKIYCLINNDRKEEAQIIFDLLKEGGFKDNFFEDKINFLLGITDKTDPKISDNNLLNFYLSYVTSDSFEYKPSEKTDKYIWKYLSAANLIKVNNFEDEEVMLTYEQAAEQNSFDKDEIFKIYLQIDYNFNQLMNAEEIHKNLPGYKARALIYQSMLLSDRDERKIDLAFLLKDLFSKEKLYNVYNDEFSRVLKSINIKNVSDDYADLVNQNLNRNLVAKIKYDNDVIHRSKIIKHFLDNNEKLGRTEKDFKSVYKKIKRNKKYFISIKDVVVFESLAADGVNLPNDLNYTALSSELAVPQNLQDLVAQNQLGLVMLKIVEIIGEDKVKDLDPETIYFLNRILNDLNLKKIRNSILSEALPLRV